MKAHPFTNPEVALQFILAGRARFTLRNKKTGTRFTYRVTASKDGRVHLASVMTDEDNEASFTYLGCVYPTGLRYTAKSSISATAQSHMALDWSLLQLTEGKLPATFEVWHEGKCGRCGRTLTAPESLASGLGPECV
jgi:hypothetical protein